MRKWILLALTMGAIVATWYYVRTYARVDPPWSKPEYGEITRGDITVPILATGLIESPAKVEVKSKASGEVIRIRVTEGDFVHTGDVLMTLKPDDEQRAVDRAKAELQRASALFESAKLGADKAKAAIDNSLAQLDRAKAESERTRSDYEAVMWRYKENLGASLQEKVTAESLYAVATAQVRVAEAAVKTAYIAEKEAGENIKLQDAIVTSATKTLEDAEERLRETTVIAKHDAIVTDVPVKVGTLIQSGTQSFTGGTKVAELADVSKKTVVVKVDSAVYGRILSIAPIDALPKMPGLPEAAAADTEGLALRTGKVRLTVDAYRDDTFEGMIERVEPQGKQVVGATQMQFDVHVLITDQDQSRLPLGAQAQVEFTVDKSTACLRVPAEAIMRYNDQPGIWLKVDPPAGSNKRYGKRFIPCRIGITDGEFTEIVSVIGEGKIDAGQKVYTKLPRGEDAAEE
ncbi:MAG: biotin/lipoyl-binding protein [Phycisphaerales bacterium]|nr:biotin/lipoyl-binding protein [Phycisphaerales bacterium]